MKLKSGNHSTDKRSSHAFAFQALIHPDLPIFYLRQSCNFLLGDLELGVGVPSLFLLTFLLHKEHNEKNISEQRNIPIFMSVIVFRPGGIPRGTTVGITKELRGNSPLLLSPWPKELQTPEVGDLALEESLFWFSFPEQAGRLLSTPHPGASCSGDAGHAHLHCFYLYEDIKGYLNP